jgi:hypothetical protein
MSRTSVVERAPDGKSKDVRFGFPGPQKVVNLPARRHYLFDLPTTVVRLALRVVDVRSIAARVAVVAMAYLLWRAL